MNTAIRQSANSLLMALMVLMASAVLVGCDRDGPLENAGEEIDQAVDDVGDNLEEAGEEIEDEIDDATDG